jgi:hypothetical protein
MTVDYPEAGTLTANLSMLRKKSTVIVLVLLIE